MKGWAWTVIGDALYIRIIMEQNDFKTTRMDSRERLKNQCFLPGDLIAGRYEFVRWLGQGGMGKVCLCKDTKDEGCNMALKMVPDILKGSAAAEEALRTEYRKMLKLTHDGIVPVRNLEDDDFRFYVVMDYAQGETLESYLKIHPKPGLRIMLEVVSRLSAVLDYAHAKNMVHRDVKPANVMVVIDGERVKSVKLLDFGLGLQIRENVSHISGVMSSGTPAYKAPEQWRPDLYDWKITVKADMYALGAVAYEMLEGRYPFADFDLSTFPNAVLNLPPQALDDQPDHVNDALRKALAKKPEDRFDNCVAFTEAMKKQSKARQTFQSPKKVESPKSNIPHLPVDSQQSKAKPWMVSSVTKTSKKSSKIKKWIVIVVAIVGILALMAGLSAENESRKRELLEHNIIDEPYIEDITPLASEDKNHTLTVSSYKQGNDYVVELNDVKMMLKYIQAGSFTMGSPMSEKDRSGDELQHHVTLTKDYWIGETEVTQEQYWAVMGRDPLKFVRGRTYPVENVSWADALAFCERLTKEQRDNGHLPDGYEYTLPTEAQWEYAARGGHKSGQYLVFSGSNIADDVAWYFGGRDQLDDATWNFHEDRGTRPVAMKKRNEIGLYDMSGNVWEWCRDWYRDYPDEAVTDPNGPSEGTYRVLRGGASKDHAKNCRSAGRYYYDPAYRIDNRGFRVALAPVQ